MSNEALEEFDRFCRFIDGLHINGFVENDFMSKKIQEAIRTQLKRAEELEAKLEMASSALNVAKISHENLYKMSFGENSDPNDDIVYNQIIETLTQIRNNGRV